MGRQVVLDCYVCDGNGCYAGNGATCRTCKGWGKMLFEVLGPSDGTGNAQTEDIETAYAARAREAAEQDAADRALGFEAWDGIQVERALRERRRREFAVHLDSIVPEWTLS